MFMCVCVCVCVRKERAQHFPTLKIDFYFLYTECGGLVCLFARAHTYTHPQEWVTLRPISRVSVLGKSVLPRVLVRVTLLLPAHLPVLIGQRVSLFMTER